MKTSRYLLSLFAFAGVCLPGFSHAAAIQGLGHLSGQTESRAWGISADGLTVIGDSGDIGGRSFRWTASGGLQDLGMPAGFDSVFASAISADGKVIVGQLDNFSSELTQAFRWMETGGLVSLGNMPGGTFSAAYGVSADGSTIVGESDGPSGFTSFRWTMESGLQAIGKESGSISSLANAVSGNGEVIVGDSYFPIGEVFTKAYIYTSTTGFRSLGGLTPGGEINANAISSDGSVVIGWSDIDPDEVQRDSAFRWTATDGMVSLGVLPGSNFSSRAWDLTADGSVIVGFGSYYVPVPGDPDSTMPVEVPFYWNESKGMRSLEDVLTFDFGVDLTGWTLERVFGISDDGSAMTGYGIHNGVTEAWYVNGLVVVPEPCTGALLVGGLLCLAFSARPARRFFGRFHP